MLCNIVSVGFYVWNSRKLVPAGGRKDAQSRKSHTNKDAAGPCPAVSVAAVSNNVSPDDSETLITASIGEKSFNALDPTEESNNTTVGKIHGVKLVKIENATHEGIDEVESMEADSTTLLVSALDDNEGKFLSVSQYSHKHHKTVEIFVNIRQITKLPYPLREGHDENNEKLRVSISQNGFY